MIVSHQLPAGEVMRGLIDWDQGRKSASGLILATAAHAA